MGVVIFTDVYQTAIRMLTRRDHSAYEVFEKLTRKNFPEEDINKVIQLLTNENLVSDKRFSKAYTRMRVEKGFGPMKIRLELRERGVARELIDHEINKYATDWQTRVKHVREKRFGETLPEEWNEHARQSRFLQARGFLSEHIHSALKNTSF